MGIKIALAVLASSLAIATVAVVGAPRVSQRDGADDPARLLRGAIDIHVHAAPDNVARSIDALDLARIAQSSGMRAIVLKNHYEPTAGLAFLARKVAPNLEIFGGIDLNLTVGGMNPIAVEHMTTITGHWGRIVWMSTFDAENQVRFSNEKRPFVSVSRGGELLPETKAVVAVIAKHGLVLATGHVSADEGLLLLAEGKKQGVRHMVVTHAINPPIQMDVAKMKTAAGLGAYIEFVGSSMVNATAATRVDRIAEAIRQVGPEFCILSSDLGQEGNPVPPDGFAAFLAALRAKGFTREDITRMAADNPARLLGLGR